MRIKQQSGWIAHGCEADSANRLLSGNGARLFSHVYFRASRPSGQLDLRYNDVATALKRSKRSIESDFAELKEKGICRVDSAVNQHRLVHIEICDQFWPFVKDCADKPDAATEYISQILQVLQARACVKCDFGPADEKFARDLFARRISVKQVDRAIRLGCARKYTSLVNGRESKPIRSLAYFEDLIDEVGNLDPSLWDHCIEVERTMEHRWRKQQGAASQNFAPARRKNEKQTR